MRIAVEIGGAWTVLPQRGWYTFGDGTTRALSRLHDDAGAVAALGAALVPVEEVPEGKVAVPGTWAVRGTPPDLVYAPDWEDAPLPPPDPVRLAYRLSGIDPDAPPEATVTGTAVPFDALEAGTFYPDGFLVSIAGATYAVARGGFVYGAWDAAALIALNHLVPAAPSTEAWQAGVAYVGDNTAGAGNGDVRTFGGGSYRCLQSHTSQAAWTPPAVPALWLAL